MLTLLRQRIKQSCEMQMGMILKSMQIDLKILLNLLIKYKSRGLTGGKYDTTVDQMKYKLINDFNRRVAQLTVDPNITAEQAAAQAYAEIETRFKSTYLGQDSASRFENGAYKRLLFKTRLLQVMQNNSAVRLIMSIRC